MTLYKYLQPARLDVLEHKRIRFTQPGEFNDPFEFRPQIRSAASDADVLSFVEKNFDRLVDEELAKYGALVTPDVQRRLKELLPLNKTGVLEQFRRLQPHVLDDLAKSIDSSLNQNVGVLCLSEVKDSILMWGHYTDNHRGFVVGFDSDHGFFAKRRSEQDEFGFLRKVNYQRERPEVMLSDTSSPAWFQTKSEQWAYEREWRIVSVLSEADYRNNSAPFPVCLFGFPQDAVLEIVIGMRSTPSLIQQVRSLAAHFPTATLLIAREDSSSFSMAFEGIG